jgi:hypothetical protein
VSIHQQTTRENEKMQPTVHEKSAAESSAQGKAQRRSPASPKNVNKNTQTSVNWLQIFGNFKVKVQITSKLSKY